MNSAALAFLLLSLHTNVEIWGCRGRHALFALGLSNREQSRPSIYTFRAII